MNVRVCALTGINTVASLLWHLPTGIIDRREVRRVTDLMEGEIATVLLKARPLYPLSYTISSRAHSCDNAWLQPALGYHSHIHIMLQTSPCVRVKRSLSWQPLLPLGETGQVLYDLMR